MRVLVFNAGSSSLKLGVHDIGMTSHQRLKATFDRFGGGRCVARITGPKGTRQEALDHADIPAVIAAVPALLGAEGLGAPDAVGHRVAHGGARFTDPARVDDALLAEVEALTPLAPLHNPAGLAGMRAAMAAWPGLPQVAVFDTAFHLTNPPRATTYAIPAPWRDAGMRRYGFHGTSHKYVAERAAAELGEPLRDLRLVSLHLGNGASACAILNGESIDSSMGLTPLEGLVMGTRSGDVDPGLFGFLERRFGLSAAEVEDALYRESGLLALAGVSDMQEVEARAEAGDSAAQLAIEVCAYRARKYLGAYAAAMGGLDTVVFTGGIGENSASMRRRICDGLGFLGLHLDQDRNLAVDLSDGAAPQIQAYGSRVRVLVTETAEQLMIAQETACHLARPAPGPAVIPVAVSARHVHLDAAAVAALFGAGHVLRPACPLRQPGHWVAEERVTLEGPRGRLERVAILGPLRDRVQVEVSRTDSFALGLDPPVRDSGRLQDTPHLRLIGPAGTHETDGLIIAARHIHTNPADAARLGLADGDVVDVQLGSPGREVTFARTLVRVSPVAVTEMHIDTDEANAAGLHGAAEGEILPHPARIAPS
ncbi:acetate/propionate family kinase [Halodurantibacterium flavum]|uniref:Acetate kinase n=1 Tax=Halodurantibacterium flavum TaxID=1382802 RepID=A0ABW4S4X1_9RHOB